MFDDFARAQSISGYRPYKSPTRSGPGGVPLYPNLAKYLVSAGDHPDPDGVIPHVMATCAAYAYAGFGQRGDPETVAMIMARMGLEENRCRILEQRVGAMYITSCASLVQSADGRVVILCYRGTQPEDVISILTDADVVPEQIELDLDGERHAVHAGFYRNMRATRYLVMRALQRAADGYSIERDDSTEEVPNPLEALYITGHSLGGAMAALMGVVLVNEPAYAPIAEKLKAIYTFGQPMLGDHAFAEKCERSALLRDNLIRYIYDRDIVPHLPPRPVGPYASFGREYHYEKDLGALDGVFAAAGDLFDQVVSVPGDLIAALRDPGRAAAALVTDLGRTANDASEIVRDVGQTAARVLVDPTGVGRLIQEEWAGRPGEWKERKGADRSEQIQNLSGLTIVAPVAFLSRRLELTRTFPFKYSFEDHVPTHYITALTPPGVRSEYGDVR